MKRVVINALVDVCCLVTLVPSALSGLVLSFVLPPGGRGSGWMQFLGIPRNQWVAVHNSSSLLFIALLVLHLLLHWKFFWNFPRYLKTSAGE
ncbi:MAG: DUF4405 domain-containing protein [Methanolinea sp.]